MKTLIRTLGLAALLPLAALPVGCQDENEPASCADYTPPDATGDTSAALTVEDCVKSIGWQYDFVIDTDMNGIMTAEGGMCLDSTTAEWFEEDATSDGFSHVLAWDSVNSCENRTPPPDIDLELCRFRGTHSWEAIPGFDPAVRMALVEHINTVTGDYDGDGTDDKCGPANLLEGTTTRYVVEMRGACGSGTKLELWEPEAGDDEAYPGDMYVDGGRATPAVICHQPGTLEQADHMPGRLICPTSMTIMDED
ncbi:MAG: hypothetical protein HY905_06670 [Deltaproteobacteria bacterium]|nr:hypothetical protein [Deltaproteobacteria bacterium]